MRLKPISTQPARRPRRGGTAVHLAATVLALPLLLLACDGEDETTPLGPEVPGELPAAALVCTADVRAGTLSCATPAPELGEGVQGALTLGGQGENVLLTSTNVCYEAGCEPDAADDVFQADVTVQNLILQALGTTDGTTGHVDGVRIFFHSGPTVTAGTGTVTVANADGTGAFTGSNQPYFQYGGEIGGNPQGELDTDGLLSTGEVSAAKTWRWNVPATATTFEFTVFVHAEVQYPNGWLDITPAADTLEPGHPTDGTVTLTVTPRDVLGGEIAAGTITWSSSDDAIATVTELDASTARVTAVAPGTVTITATDGTLSGTATITVGAALADDNYPETVIGNVSVNSANADDAFSVTDNDALEGGATIAFAGWSTVADSTEFGGTVDMTASGTGMGQFTYEPPTGFEGTDRFIYVIGEDTATVSLTVSGMIWFIDNNSACTDECDGRLSHPFTSLGGFAAANDGAAGHPADGDAIFLYESTTDYTGPVTLRAGQILVGQDASGSLAGITGITPGASSEPLPPTDASNPNSTETTIAGTSGGIVLGTNNTLRGVNVATTGGTGISGDGFGTLSFDRDFDVDVSGGAAIDLANGTFDGIFRSVSADGGTNGIILSNVSGNFTVGGNGSDGTGGTIQNMTGDGISLTGTTTAVVLNWMTIQNNGGSGIRGNNVVSLALRNTTVDSNGDAAGEHGLHFTELTGASEISNSTVSGSRDDGVSIANTSDTLDLEITDSHFSDVQDIASLRHGVTITASGTAIVNLTATGNEFTGHKTDNLSYAAAGTAGGNVVISQNTFSGAGDDGISIIGDDDDGTWGGELTYDVDDNVLSGSHSNAIRVEMTSSATAAATMSGTIRNNTIGTPQEPCGDNNGIFIAGDGAGEHSAAVTDNLIDGCDFEGIAVSAANGSGRFDLEVQGNDVRNLGASALDSFGVVMGNPGDTNTLCLVLGGTTAAEKNTFDLGFDYMFFQQTTSSTPLLIPGFSPGGGDLSTELNDFLKVRNLAQGGGDAAAPSAWPLENVQGAANCNTP